MMMKTLYLLVAALLLCSVQGRSLKSSSDDEENVTSVVCPESTDGMPVFLPNPEDCTKYYECQGDWAIPMDCAPPLFFDPSLDVCNWPSEVDCQQPATEEPVTEEPATEEPVTEEPVTEEPATEEPATEEPVTEEPVTEEPVTEEPVTEEPTTEEPATEEPATEEPVTEEPATEEPATAEPVTDEPVAP